MANEQIFNGAARPYRHELKYLINEGERLLLSRKLGATMAQDPYAAKNGGSYHIRSLYFDDPDNSAVTEKMDGVEERDKYRMRIYNYSDKSIKMERKHKNGPYIAKSSLSLTRKEADMILEGNYRFLLGRKEPFAGQLFGVLTLNRLRPKVLVDYDREPYVFPVQDVRITFDSDIRTGLRNVDIFNPNVPMYPTMEVMDSLILEVKFNTYLPEYIRYLIQPEAASRTAASKYIYCRQYGL